MSESELAYKGLLEGRGKGGGGMRIKNEMSQFSSRSSKVF